MSEDQIQALISAFKGDKALMERLNGAADLDAVVAIAKEAGFDVTREELLQAQAQQSVELSDDELDAVVGAKYGQPVVSQHGGCSTNSGDFQACKQVDNKGYGDCFGTVTKRSY